MFKWVREHLGRRPGAASDPVMIPVAEGGVDAAAAPAGPENLFPFDSDKFLTDPYPFYRCLRDEAPLYQSPDGYWVISRYDDNLEALAHPALGNSPSRFSTLHGSKAARFECASVAANILPFLDGAAHRAHRSVLASLFQKQVREWSPRLAGFTEQALDGLTEEFEVMADFATPLAHQSIRSLLGFPEDERLSRWSDHFFYLFTKIPSVELREEIDASLAEYRRWGASLLQDSGGTGLVGTFRAAVESGTLTSAVAVDTLLLLFADGVQNVDTGIANALHALAHAPEQWSRLCADESQIAQAVEECLRFDSPAQFVARTVLEDFEWYGTMLKRDHTVFLLLASANRDPAQFENADVFELDRPRGQHISFGKGRHACIGGNFFEMELKAVLAGMRERFRSLELTSPAVWQKRTGHRWIESARFRVTSIA